MFKRGAHYREALHETSSWAGKSKYEKTDEDTSARTKYQRRIYFASVTTGTAGALMGVLAFSSNPIRERVLPLRVNERWNHILRQRDWNNAPTVLGFASFLSGQSIFLPWAMKPLTQLKTPFGAKLRERLTELGEGKPKWKTQDEADDHAEPESKEDASIQKKEKPAWEDEDEVYERLASEDSREAKGKSKFYKKEKEAAEEAQDEHTHVHHHPSELSSEVRGKTKFYKKDKKEEKEKKIQEEEEDYHDMKEGEEEKRETAEFHPSEASSEAKWKRKFYKKEKQEQSDDQTCGGDSRGREDDEWHFNAPQSLPEEEGEGEFVSDKQKSKRKGKGKGEGRRDKPSTDNRFVLIDDAEEENQRYHQRR